MLGFYKLRDIFTECLFDDVYVKLEQAPGVFGFEEGPDGGVFVDYGIADDVQLLGQRHAWLDTCVVGAGPLVLVRVPEAVLGIACVDIGTAHPGLDERIISQWLCRGRVFLVEDVLFFVFFTKYSEFEVVCEILIGSETGSIDGLILGDIRCRSI